LTYLDETELMRKLPGGIKMHIVIGLACFDTPVQVAASVKETFGLDVSRQQVEAYHPERRAGAKLDAKWRAVFYETRARLLAELDGIPIACQAYRLRQLGRILDQAERMNNIALALQIIEQAAKEVGGMYLKPQATTAMPVSAAAPLGPDSQL